MTRKSQDWKPHWKVQTIVLEHFALSKRRISVLLLETCIVVSNKSSMTQGLYLLNNEPTEDTFDIISTCLKVPKQFGTFSFFKKVRDQESGKLSSAKCVSIFDESKCERPLLFLDLNQNNSCH
uniref:Uncharacterized protein n=1 Tax=Micrurus surinamensis TaxID=129470 RepID=A0A2D4NQ95_MICSU